MKKGFLNTVLPLCAAVCLLLTGCRAADAADRGNDQEEPMTAWSDNEEAAQQPGGDAAMPAYTYSTQEICASISARKRIANNCIAT